MWKTFLVGAAGYPLIELAYRRRTHWTMALTGGACLVILRTVCARHARRALPVRCAIGALAITGVELCVGLVVNRLLALRVWDYSGRRGNVLGQICPAYTAAWFALCVPVMWMLDRARTKS